MFFAKHCNNISCGKTLKHLGEDSNFLFHYYRFPYYQQSYFTDSKLLADGSLISFGRFITANDPTNPDTDFDFYLQKLRPDGTLDSSFGTNGTTRIHLWAGRNYAAHALKIQPDNKILIAGDCDINTYTDNVRRNSGFGFCAMRLMPNGTLDASFGGNQQITLYNGAVGVPDSLYTMPSGTVYFDSSYQANAGNNVAGASAVDTAPNGDIILAGKGAIPGDLAMYPDGYSTAFAEVIRLNSSGALINRTKVSDLLDPVGSHNSDRQFNAVAVQSDGKVLAGGFSSTTADTNAYSSRAIMVKIAADGTVEQSFESPEMNSFGNILSITFTRSNKILISGGGLGGAFGVGGGGRSFLYRLNGDFTFDTSFGTGGTIIYCNISGTTCPDKYTGNFNNYIKVGAIQPDGKILALNGDRNGYDFPRIVRLNPDGSLDRSFGNDNTNSDIRFRGSINTNSSGVDQVARSLNLRPNGKIVTAGYVGVEVIGLGRATVTQYLNTSKNGVYSDFDNDGKADLSVFRPSSGVWYQLSSFNNSFSALPFGQAGDKIVPADYDGDGRTDKAVFRNGIWYILNSSNNGFRAVQFGQAGDIALPGDFNGDGQADLAVFRPSSGVWYILYSNPIQPGNITFTALQFGQNGDLPLLADFDGDGKSDIAVWRPSNGVWYYLRSSDGGFRATQFGQSGDVPVVGDYDADSKSDLAVFRSSNGVWYRLNSSNNGVAATQFGQAGDVATPGDYDNDGKNDLAVYRNGVWYVLRSSDNGVTTAGFGFGTDIPVPAAYLP